MQNYFQFDKFLQPNKGVVMGSPIFDLVAEIFLQYCEHLIVKSNFENNNIVFYNRYVDDILIIYDNYKTNADEILVYMNNLHNHLEFKLTKAKNGTIRFLDSSITRDHDELTINIFRIPTTTERPFTIVPTTLWNINLPRTEYL
jgi:hypothetical protein